jgi:hypothetical protein
MRSLGYAVVAAMGLGLVGGCAANRLMEVGEGMRAVEPVTVTMSGEPLKLADGAAPADQQAKEDPKAGLPAGHPPVGGAGAGQAGLPSGHPPVGGAAPAAPGGLPPGHPPMDGGAGGATGLPSGHPDVSSGGAPRAGTVAPGPVRNGSISVKAVQGTRGGPAVGADPVLVEFYNAQGKVIGKTDSKLTEKGEVMIGQLAFAEPVQPMITVTHQGVEYRAVGSVLTSREAAQQVEMTVYEATDEEPAWVVKMRHVMLANSPDGVHVTEMVSLHNPSDRAWVGSKSGSGKPVTLRLPLAAGAKDVKFVGGFHECCTKVVDGAIVYEMPMTPGDTNFQFTYRVPADAAGSAKIELTAPAATQHLMVFVPDDGSTFTSDALRKIEPKKNTNLRANSRFYVTDPMKAKAVVGFTIGGLAGVKAAPEEAGAAAPVSPYEGENPAPTDAGPAGRVPKVAKIVGGVGAGAIVVVGAVVVLFKAPKGTSNETVA